MADKAVTAYVADRPRLDKAVELWPRVRRRPLALAALAWHKAGAGSTTGFVLRGVRKLLDLAGTAHLIEGKLWIPDVVAPYAEKLSTMSGMPTPQLVAIVLAIVQIVFALFIIFNVGSRFAAIVLAI